MMMKMKMEQKKTELKLIADKIDQFKIRALYQVKVETRKETAITIAGGIMKKNRITKEMRKISMQAIQNILHKIIIKENKPIPNTG